MALAASTYGMRQKPLQFDAGLCRHFFHGRAEAESKNIFSRRGYLTRLFQRGKAAHFFVISDGPDGLKRIALTGLLAVVQSNASGDIQRSREGIDVFPVTPRSL